MASRRRFYSALRRGKSARRARMASTAEYKKWLKDRGLLRCEVCAWCDPLMLPYFGIEIHHIKRYADGGPNDPRNYLAACPNHHRLADRLSTRDPNMTKEAIVAMILEHEHRRSRVV